MTDDVRVIKQDEEVEIRDGKVRSWIRVQFMVGEDGPFWKRFDAATFTGHGARLELDTFARELRTLRGL